MRIYFNTISHVWLLTLLLLLTACGDDEQPDISTVAEEFGKAYFNYDFNKASSLCTSESQRWIRFAASNIYKADIEVLRSMDHGSTVEVDGVDYGDNDSTATVRLEVAGGMVRDTIGNSGHVTDEKLIYSLMMVERNGGWWVRLEGLPRIEK